MYVKFNMGIDTLGNCIENKKTTFVYILDNNLSQWSNCSDILSYWSVILSEWRIVFRHYVNTYADCDYWYNYITS